MSKRALILFGHGARDAEWATPFKHLQTLLRAQSDLVVECAFLELMSPSLPEAVSALANAGITHIAIAPIFIAQGGHLKSDLAKLLGTLHVQYPDVKFTLMPALGEAEPILNSIAQWLIEETK